MYWNQYSCIVWNNKHCTVRKSYWTLHKDCMKFYKWPVGGGNASLLHLVAHSDRRGREVPVQIVGNLQSAEWRSWDPAWTQEDPQEVPTGSPPEAARGLDELNIGTALITHALFANAPVDPARVRHIQDVWIQISRWYRWYTSVCVCVCVWVSACACVRVRACVWGGGGERENLSVHE